MLYFMRFKGFTAGFLHPKVACSLAETYISPSLFYGNECFKITPYLHSSLVSFLKEVAEYILGLHTGPTIPTAFLIWEAGLKNSDTYLFEAKIRAHNTLVISPVVHHTIHIWG